MRARDALVAITSRAMYLLRARQLVNRERIWYPAPRDKLAEQVHAREHFAQHPACCHEVGTRCQHVVEEQNAARLVLHTTRFRIEAEFGEELRRRRALFALVAGRKCTAERQAIAYVER